VNPANQPLKQRLIITKIGENNGGGRNLLSKGIKLKGEENYVA
jgi:hypothetical protein